MELATYITILTAVSLIAPFVIEAIKKLLRHEFDVNALSAITTAVISFFACMAMVIIKNIALTSTEIVYIIGTVFFSVLGSLCGYDKIFSIIFDIFKRENK